MRRLFALVVTLCLVGAAPAAPPDDVAMELRGDPDDTITVEIPADWKATDRVTASNKLAEFRGDIRIGEQQTWGLVFTQFRPGYVRSELMLESYYTATKYVEIPGSRVEGDDFTQIALVWEGSDWIEVQRATEKHGRVYVTRLQIGVNDDTAIAVALKDVAPKILNTMQVGVAPQSEELPESWKSRTFKGLEIHTDVADKAKTEPIIREILDVRAMTEKVLPGEPFWDAAPALRIFSDQRSFGRFVTANGRSPKERSHYLSRARVLAIDASRVDRRLNRGEVFWDTLRREATAQYEFHYFGGRAPVWFDLGLVNYTQIAADSGGRADRPNAYWIGVGQEAVSTAKKLDKWFDVQWSQVSDVQRAARELWAWHSFMRHGRGKPAKAARAALGAYTAELRASGRPSIAVEAFADTDHIVLWKGLLAFATRWK